MDYNFKTQKNSDFKDESNYWLTRPMYCQVFDWFKENHQLYGRPSIDYSLTCDEPIQFCFIIDDSDGMEESANYTTWEEAELACLNKLIEVVKKKQ